LSESLPKDQQEKAPGGWVEFRLAGPLAALELFADFMAELEAGGAVFSEDPEGKSSAMVTVFLPLSRSSPGVMARVKARAHTLQQEFPGLWGQLETTTIEDTDWAEQWKQEMEPERIEPGIWIAPTFKEPPREAQGEPVIRLDPGMAFGTGGHVTTRDCMKVVAERVKAGAKNVLDLGTGTGILAMTAARFGAERVLAMDLDPVALEVARFNLDLNGLSRKVELAQGVSDPETDIEAGPFDLVAANLFAETLAELMPLIARHLAPGGTAVLSGILDPRSGWVRQAAESAGLVVESVKEEDEWVTMVVRPGRKRKAGS